MEETIDREGISEPVLEMKTGKEYWDQVRKTAEKVQKWPDWKTGKQRNENE